MTEEAKGVKSNSVDKALALEFQKRLRTVNLSDLARLSGVPLRSLRVYRNSKTQRASILTIGQVGPWLAEALPLGERRGARACTDD
jgi:hypothetical protein